MDSSSLITGGIEILTRQSLSPALSTTLASDVVFDLGTPSGGNDAPAGPRILFIDPNSSA